MAVLSDGIAEVTAVQAGGDRDGDREDVIRDQTGGRDQAGDLTQVVCGHDVRAATVRIGADRLSVGRARPPTSESRSLRRRAPTTRGRIRPRAQGLRASPGGRRRLTTAHRRRERGARSSFRIRSCTIAELFSGGPTNARLKRWPARLTVECRLPVVARRLQFLRLSLRGRHVHQANAPTRRAQLWWTAEGRIEGERGRRPRWKAGPSRRPTSLSASKLVLVERRQDRDPGLVERSRRGSAALRATTSLRGDRILFDCGHERRITQLSSGNSHFTAHRLGGGPGERPQAVCVTYPRGRFACRLTAAPRRSPGMRPYRSLGSSSHPAPR